MNMLFSITVSDSSTTTPGGKRAHWFTTTHWSIVVAADGTDSMAASAAMEHLCQAYWYPLYAYVRRLGHSSHDAEDVIQGFFAQAIADNCFATAD